MDSLLLKLANMVKANHRQSPDLSSSPLNPSLCTLPHRPGEIICIFLAGRGGKLKTMFRSFLDIHYEDRVMNKDQINGRIKETKGKAREITGKLVNDKSMEEKGKVQTAIGKVQAWYGDLKDDLENGLKKSS